MLGSTLLIDPGPSSAQAVDVPPLGGDIRSRSRLTGNWNGLRDELGKKGVVLDTDLLLTPQGIMSGGKGTDAGIWGTAIYTLNVDTDKLGLWPGGFFKFQGMSTFGHSVLGNTGAIVPPNEAWLFPGLNQPASGLMNATFTQFLSPKVGLVAGKINILDLITGTFAGDYRTQFLNTGINLPMAFALTPISAFGGGTILLPTQNITLMAMAVDANGTATNNDVGKAFENGTTVLAAGKVTIKPFGLVGNQSVTGMWSDKSRLSLIQDPSNVGRGLLTERYPRLAAPGPLLQGIIERYAPELLVPVQPANREDSTWAIAYGFDQYLWQPAGDPKRGIGVFFNFGTTDGRANPIQYSYNMGIVGNGVVPGRPRDTLGLGWARTQFSDNFAPLLRARLPLGLEHEDAIEIYYNASITPWLNLTPDLQIIEPGLKKTLGSSGNLNNVNTVIMGGLRVYIRF
ncbi:carbohydrate porin [Nitrosospira sp. Nsp2]|uniref:carbohydrate porin n=1 Tax=Nitrosospira sp. Nsp2 TaxID=136548 RepID=UPI000D312EF1|nr:carbohydrate porin [Nitrosospira sp. Nsp2]